MWVRMMTQLVVRNIAISTRGDQCRSPGRNSTTETDDLAIVFKHDAYGFNAQLG